MNHPTNAARRDRGFTLVELLMVISIISILAAMAALALAGAAEEGRIARARTQVSKIDQLINEKWNSYRYRKVPVDLAGLRPIEARQKRLNALRELMKFELPDRLSDFCEPTGADNPAAVTAQVRWLKGSAPPSVARAYARKVTKLAFGDDNTNLNRVVEQSECLYLILSEMRDGDRSALNMFMPSEIGDTDLDGMYEILDPWGTPIVFLRWAPGYSKFTNSDSEVVGSVPNIPAAVDTMQVPNGLIAPDPFDPLKCDPRWSNPNLPNTSTPRFTNHAAVCRPFALRPLVLSAGPDKLAGIITEMPKLGRYYNTPVVTDDPYVIMNAPNADAATWSFVSTIDQSASPAWLWLGSPVPFPGAGLQTGDNITNHAQTLVGE